MKMTFITKRPVVCQDKSHGTSGKEVAIGSKVRLYPDGQMYGLGDCHPSPWDAKPKAKATPTPKLAKTPKVKAQMAKGRHDGVHIFGKLRGSVPTSTPKATLDKVLVQVGTKHTPKRGASRGTVQRATWTIELDANKFKTRASQVEEAKRQAGQFGTVNTKAKVF